MLHFILLKTLLGFDQLCISCAGFGFSFHLCLPFLPFPFLVFSQLSFTVNAEIIVSLGNFGYPAADNSVGGHFSAFALFFAVYGEFPFPLRWFDPSLCLRGLFLHFISAPVKQ